MTSLILNTGIQMLDLGEVTIDFNENVMKPLRFFEFQMRDKVFLDPVYFFPMKGMYLKRTDLVCNGYLDPNTNVFAPEEVFNENMNWLDDSKILSVNRLNIPLGEFRKSGMEQLENRWLPMPFFERSTNASVALPRNWCRIKFVPVPDKCTATKKIYKLTAAFDTTENHTEENSSPHFNGQPFKFYSLCGLSYEDINGYSDHDRNTTNNVLLPLKAYEFCNPNKNPWLNVYLKEILACEDLMKFSAGQRMKYLVYYIYLITYLHHRQVLPDIKLYNDASRPAISANLVLDVGNSRTFGLVAEDPLDHSFSKSSIVELRNLDNGERYAQPFDMRLCFKDERFGLSSGDGQFRWPSLVRLGKEAMANIYSDDDDLSNSGQFDTNYSSPKRYLWDTEPYRGEWKFISEKDRVVGPSKTVFMEGVCQQFYSDGSFSCEPMEMGEKSCYSRSSLMTFCFMEILLQVRMQINSPEFREKNGEEATKREIKRVILTCPTAMSKAEQIRLRKCMEEASTVLKRFYGGSYMKPYVPSDDRDKVEIIPSVKDLSLPGDSLDMRVNWSYDEATCCQMVYLYSEIRRYLGNARQFIDLYGRRRRSGDAVEDRKSLTLASIDIGAGTTDIMICNYKEQGESIIPTPLFWDTFHVAGDDLVKRIITDVIIDFPDPAYPGASGIIYGKLKSMNVPDIHDRMHHFFDDTQAMGVVEKRMRKEFCVQVLIPVANHLLDLLQKDSPDCVLKFEDIFREVKPASSLMAFFGKQMGFRFEDLVIKYSRDYLNGIVCKVFETSFRKFAAVFYTYRCDIVLMGGRPCSLRQVGRLMKRLTPVTPDRLVSMNDYRVGSWYPGSSDTGHFGDKKSMVAVGALISYLAEKGKLPMFKLTTENLKTKIISTADYIGILNPHTGALQNVLTPEVQNSALELSAFPEVLGCRQIDVPGFPSQMLYVLDFDERYLRTRAEERLRGSMGAAVTPDAVQFEMDTLRSRAKQGLPLKFRIERDFYNDKEKVKIESVENSDHDELPTAMFRLSLQTWAEDETNWLDSGKFILHIGM